MITKSDANDELKNSLSIFEIAIPTFNLAILALLYQVDLSAATTTAHYLYKMTLALTLAGILLFPFYLLRNWSQSRLKVHAFNTAEKYTPELQSMAERNDTSSKLGDYMSARDKWNNKFHLLDVKITTGLIRILVPIFFVDLALCVVLVYLLKM